VYQLVEFEAGENEIVLVEVDVSDPGVVRAKRPGEIVGRAAQSIEAALESIRPVANAFVDKVQTMKARPAEVSVQFGVKLTMKAGAVIAGSEAEGQFQVTLTWRPS
jgi:hypothetical protein